VKFLPTDIPDVVEIVPLRHGDARGYFSEVFRADLFAAHVGPVRFMQDNVSLSERKGTVRGLHYQVAPNAQGKLITCLDGAILDVAVDLRPGSPTHRQHVARRLTAEAGNWLWIPDGFAHGFCTLTDAARVLYKVTAPYSPADERGIAFDDVALGIDWPVTRSTATLSARDAALPVLS
jgi:dTDP-4-dehydrorhamnose 3,5-epimerase